MKYRINLYTESFRPKSQVLGPPTLLLSVAAALVLVLLSGMVLQQTNQGLEQQVQALEVENGQLQQGMLELAARLEKLAEDPAMREALRDAHSAIEGKRQLLAHLDASQSLEETRFSAVMHALARSQVKGLWLTRVRAAGEHLLLNGSSLSEELVPQWIGALSRQENFDGKKFSYLELSRAEDENAGHLDFSLSTRLEQEGDKSG
jgi:Tfp pilus assembly protein PilN